MFAQITKEQAATLKSGQKIRVCNIEQDHDYSLFPADVKNGDILTLIDPVYKEYISGLAFYIKETIFYLGMPYKLIHSDICELVVDGCTCKFETWFYQGCKCGAFQREQERM